MMPDPLLEAAAERAYTAFIESAKKFLPPGVQPWNSVAHAVREAWIAAAAAARNDNAPQP
jgi:hypothetical protein